ncbi:MAG: sugar transferase [[Bacteroides] pectinophilus]|nr:sugar transferase [[Bacteroides] pectinophilus]
MNLYMIIKRIFDIVISVSALIFLTPVFAVIAVLIYHEDHGKIFYTSNRVGLNGKIFRIYKFRSMKMNADNLEDTLNENEIEQYFKEFKIVNDPRITRIGRVLRKTSLDEIPQFFNILKGDMSLIGPRPILKSELNKYYPTNQDKLLKVRPGLTGYWQSHGRNNVSYKNNARQNMELYYVDNCSFIFDIIIFLKHS